PARLREDEHHRHLRAAALRAALGDLAGPPSGPAGTRWYHSHAMAGRNLNRGTYTGRVGMFVVDAGGDPGAYDQEVPILLHEWDPRFTDTAGLEVALSSFSINGK